jgi:hypothetical protein
MALSNKLKEKIAIEVIRTLVTRFESFPEDSSNNRNAPFHESFLRAFSDKLNGNELDAPFFISLSSWLHGLNTTLGQTFFENIAHHLSNGEKREYTSKRLQNLPITQSQRNHIAQIIADLSNSTLTPHLDNENALLFVHYNDATINAMDFSADVFIEDELNVIAIELKSVKPNSGEMKGEKQKILEGKAALFNQFPGKQIQFYIGFPFDPTVNPAKEEVTSHDKPRFLSSIINMSKYFAPNETLVANELWDLLSGQKNTMEEILLIINTVSTTSFLEKFQFLSNGANRTRKEYPMHLAEWHLYSEMELIENNTTIIQHIRNNNAMTRIYNRSSLDSKGNYNWDRYNMLKEVL